MPVETKHPALTVDRLSEYKLMRDAFDGESAIKASGTVYLPMPSGFKSQKDGGAAIYNAYRERAQFPEILAPTISAMVGIVHAKEIDIEIPTGMEYLWDRATTDGLSLEAFHRRITFNLLHLGRYGVLADAPQGGGEPYLAGYAGDVIINWETDGSFFVIDDSGMVRDGYDWARQDRYIVLRMNGAYEMIEVTGKDKTEISRTMTPTRQGGFALSRIPFVVGNARDITPNVSPPPLIGVSRAAKAIYQLSADYRWQLFMSGQETLVAINGDAPAQIGAGVAHSMIGSDGVTPDLKYVSPSCSGIEAHKVAMDDNRAAAVMSGAKMIEQEQGSSNESGYARKLRLAGETATLSTVSKVSCEMLERSLRNIAMMQGLPDSAQSAITVRPPETLMDTTLTPQEVKSLVESWQAGGFAYRTLYENLQRGGIANPEREVEDELVEMDDDPEAIRQAQLDAVQNQIPAA